MKRRVLKPWVIAVLGILTAPVVVFVFVILGVAP
jgi:hypothetical protein